MLKTPPITPSSRSIDNGQAGSILNIQYSVFLGVILNYCFRVDTVSTPTVRLLIDIINKPEALFFIFYFLLDWFTANIIQEMHLSKPSMLLVRIIWITLLGTLVISLNGDGLWKFLLISFYLIVSGLYDFGLMSKLFAGGEVGTQAVLGFLLSGVRLVLGLVFLVPTVFVVTGRSDVALEWDNPNSPFDLLFIISGLYLLLKIGRFKYLSSIAEARR